MEANSTGGGSATAQPLKDYELRALQLFNCTTTTGNRSLLIEAGISRQFIVPEEFQHQPISSENVARNENDDQFDVEYLDEASNEINVPSIANNSSSTRPRNILSAIDSPPSNSSASEQVPINNVNQNRGRSLLSDSRRRRTQSRSRSQHTSNIEAYLAKVDEMEKRREESQQRMVQTITESVSTFAGVIVSLAQAISSNMSNMSQ